VWEDDGSEAFATVLQRVSQEGYLFETVALS